MNQTELETLHYRTRKPFPNINDSEQEGFVLLWKENEHRDGKVHTRKPVFLHPIQQVYGSF